MILKRPIIFKQRYNTLAINTNFLSKSSFGIEFGSGMKPCYHFLLNKFR